MSLALLTRKLFDKKWNSANVNKQLLQRKFHYTRFVLLLEVVHAQTRSPPASVARAVLLCDLAGYLLQTAIKKWWAYWRYHPFQAIVKFSCEILFWLSREEVLQKITRAHTFYMQLLHLWQLFLKENVRNPAWICKDPISLIPGTRFSLILGTRIGSLKRLKKTVFGVIGSQA